MASIVSAQHMKAAVSERKRRLFLTFMWVYGGGSHRQRKNALRESCPGGR